MKKGEKHHKEKVRQEESGSLIADNAEQCEFMVQIKRICTCRCQLRLMSVKV